MDEIFGYFRRSAIALKLPLLTLLKQARAFGLAWCCPPRTQWTSTTRARQHRHLFIGRLQTDGTSSA